MSILINPLCTTNNVIDIFSGTGDINIGTGAGSSAIVNIGTGVVAKVVNIGNNTSGSAFFLTGATSSTISIQGGILTISTVNGALNVTTGTGAISIGADVTSKTITIGSTSGTTAVTIHSGTGNINIGTSIAKTILIGNTTGASAVDIESGSGGLTIGTSSTAQNITMGNVTGNTTVTINTGTGGCPITTTNGVFSIATGTGTISISADATATTVGLATGAGAKALTLGSTNTTSAVTINTGSGGINIPSFSTTGALVSTAAGLITDATASTTGFVLASNGASTAPSFQSMSAIGGFTWNNVTSGTQAMAVNNGYISNNGASLITYTLPSTAAIGQRVAVQGAGTGLWTVAQNSGQTIHFNAVDSTTGVGGTVSSTSRYDSCEFLCITANTDWAARNMDGNFNVV